MITNQGEPALDVLARTRQEIARLASDCAARTAWPPGSAS